MSYLFWGTSRWFASALCCRYLVVRFGRLRVPALKAGVTVQSEWHWALGLFTDGQFQVLGAWADDGAHAAKRIARDLHDRGIEHIQALAGEGDLVEAMAGLRPKVGRDTAAQLADSGAFGPRMRHVIRWADAAGQHLQARMLRVARVQAPFADQCAAADFIAQAFQRADRDLLVDRADRKRPAPYGQQAFTASRACAA